MDFLGGLRTMRADGKKWEDHPFLSTDLLLEKVDQYFMDEKMI